MLLPLLCPSDPHPKVTACHSFCCWGLPHLEAVKDPVWQCISEVDCGLPLHQLVLGLLCSPDPHLLRGDGAAGCGFLSLPVAEGGRLVEWCVVVYRLCAAIMMLLYVIIIARHGYYLSVEEFVVHDHN